MQFGITFEKLLLIGLIAALLIGPERLPRYAESVAKLARRAGEFLRDTKSRVRDEMGPEIDDVDWRKLDPRQYDPRRIIREALVDEAVAPPPKPVSKSGYIESAYEQRQRKLGKGKPAPFDLEST